jgi:SNF2 family DNA or RNA helicase
VVVNLGHGDDVPDIIIEPTLARYMRPHQIEGVQFMWRNLMTDPTNGCVLAHCMGLGKHRRS